MPDKIPQCQWTHDGDRVLLVKCLDEEGKGHNGFPWPRRGKLICPKAQADRERAATVTGDQETDCASGGLFGWPWGINLGGGKEPDYRADWLVFAAEPSDVVDLGDKAKAVGEVEVVYYGDAHGALLHTLAGRIAWVEHDASGSASATGGMGSASATGWRGSASATGGRGSASATGEKGIASATGGKGSASATGGMGSASTTGGMGSASATGEKGIASATGEMGSAWTTGGMGSASTTGGMGSASASGEKGIASATGGGGSASATGGRGIAALTGDLGTVEVGPGGLGAVTVQVWYWKARPGSGIACLWRDDKGKSRRVLLSADELGLEDGKVYRVCNGLVQSSPKE